MASLARVCFVCIVQLIVMFGVDIVSFQWIETCLFGRRVLMIDPLHKFMLLIAEYTDAAVSRLR